MSSDSGFRCSGYATRHHVFLALVYALGKGTEELQRLWGSQQCQQGQVKRNSAYSFREELNETLIKTCPKATLLLFLFMRAIKFSWLFKSNWEWICVTGNHKHSSLCRPTANDTWPFWEMQPVLKNGHRFYNITNCVFSVRVTLRSVLNFRSLWFHRKEEQEKREKEKKFAQRK